MRTSNPTPISCERRMRREAGSYRGKLIRIGLVNNMPDSALQATERQFSSLLEDASGEFDVRLALINLETVPREAAIREALEQRYRTPRDLRASRLDALIVTGAEPRAPRLFDEPYWSELTELMDWAHSRMISNLYSCLAAHAAVLHRDGIARRRLPSKLSGVFTSDVVAPGELVAGLDEEFRMPHSRYNDLSEADLTASGYIPLARSPESGVDIFVKDGAALEVFLQGHPEYDADTLAREYRRDALRFLRGIWPNPPAPPAHYFAPEVSSRIASLVEGASAGSIDDVTAQLRPETLSPQKASWRPTSLRLFCNWLNAIAQRKGFATSPALELARRGGQ